MTLAVENTPAIVLSDVCRKITPLSLKLSFVAVETSISTTSPSGVRYVTVAAIEFLSHSISSVNFIGGTVSSSQNSVDCEVSATTQRNGAFTFVKTDRSARSAFGIAYGSSMRVM